MNTIRRVKLESSVPAINPLRVVAGIGAILFPLLNLLPLRFLDIERSSDSNTVALLLFVLAYVSLLPLVLVLYQELRAASQPFSAVVALFGLLPSVGVLLGAVGLVNITFAAIIMFAGLSLWIGASGYLAFSNRLLSRVWALFSAATGALGPVAALVTVVPAINSTVEFVLWSAYLFAVVVWMVWTGVMVIRRARMAPASA